MGILLKGDQGEKKISPHVIGAVEILPSNVSLPLPNVRTISQKAISKFFGNVQLKDATYQPGGEPVTLPTPKRIFPSLCGICTDNPRLGHSVYCADCIKNRARANFIDFYGRELLAWHYLLILIVGSLLIVGLVKYLPRPNEAKPMSVPVREIQKVSTKV